jgi:hypothetical protein
MALILACASTLRCARAARFTIFRAKTAAAAATSAAFCFATAAVIVAVSSAVMQPKNLTALRRMTEFTPSSRMLIICPALMAKVAFLEPSPTLAARTCLPLA